MIRIAFLAPYSKKRFYEICGISPLSVQGKDVWFFQHMPDRSVDVDIIGCLASVPYKKRLPLVTLQILSFLSVIGDYDAVISGGFLNGILLSAARKVLRLRKPPHVILDTRAIGVLNGEKTLVTRLARYLLSPVDAVICFSRNHRDFWQKTLGFRGRVAFAPWPMVGDVRHCFSTEGDYLFSGGSTKRDWGTLLSAIEDTGVPVIIAAGKDTSTGKYGLEGMHVPSNVKVLRDIPRDSYTDLLSRSHLVIIPVHHVATDVGWETLSQAMTLGKAVIATRIPPLLDYIVDGETGLFAAAKDADDLRDKILFLLAHPEQKRRIAANAGRVMEDTKSGRKAAARKVWLMLQEVCGSSATLDKADLR